MEEKSLPKIENWRMFSAIEPMQALAGMRISDTDAVLRLNEVLDRVQKRLDALQKVLRGFDASTEEGQKKLEAEMNKQFKPSWKPIPVKSLPGANFSVNDLRILRAIQVLE